MVTELCHLLSIPWYKTLEKQCFSITPDCLWSWKAPRTSAEKKGVGLVKEFIVGMILECKTHEIRDVVDEFVGWIHPNEMTRWGIQMEKLLTSGGQCNSNVAVAWTLRPQELEVFFHLESRCVFMASHVMSVILSTMNVCMASLSLSTGKMLDSMVTQGKTADDPLSQGTDGASAKGLFIS